MIKRMGFYKDSAPTVLGNQPAASKTGSTRRRGRNRVRSVKDLWLPYSGVLANWSGKNYSTTLIFLFFWATTMWKNGGLKSELPVSYRIQNVFLSFWLVFSASFNVRLIFWCILHPGLVPKYFYVQSGVFPPAITLAILLLSFGATYLGIKIGFLMAQQKQKARTLALRFIPYLLLIDILNEMRVLSSHADANPELFKFAAPVTISFIAAFYFWLFRFFQTEKTEVLKTNSSQLETHTHASPK